MKHLALLFTWLSFVICALCFVLALVSAFKGLPFFGLLVASIGAMTWCGWLHKKEMRIYHNELLRRINEKYGVTL